jgi:hypothetical protein
MSYLDDDALVEECMHINDVDTPEDVNKCYHNYIEYGSISERDRQILENFHLLSYCRSFVRI